MTPRQERVGAVLLALIAIVAGCSAAPGKPHASASSRSGSPVDDAAACTASAEPTQARPPAGADAPPPFDLGAPVGGAGGQALPAERPSGAREWAAAGDHARALAYAQDRLAIDPSRPDVWFFTAWEQRALGLLGDAHDSAAECVRLLVGTSHVEASRRCAEMAAQLAPLVGFVSIVPAPEAPDMLELHVSGRQLMPRRWTLPVAVTPDEVEVVALLAGGACIRTRVRVDAQQSLTVALEPP